MLGLLDLVNSQIIWQIADIDPLHRGKTVKPAARDVTSPDEHLAVSHESMGCDVSWACVPVAGCLLANTVADAPQVDDLRRCVDALAGGLQHVTGFANGSDQRALTGRRTGRDLPPDIDRGDRRWRATYLVFAQRCCSAVDRAICPAAIETGRLRRWPITSPVRCAGATDRTRSQAIRPGHQRR